MEKDIQKQLIQNLVKNLASLRKMAGFTQAELGAKLEISRQRIISYERGERNMPWIVFLALVCFFEHFEETKIMMVALAITGTDLDKLISNK